MGFKTIPAACQQNISTTKFDPGVLFNVLFYLAMAILSFLLTWYDTSTAPFQILVFCSYTKSKYFNLHNPRNTLGKPLDSSSDASEYPKRRSVRVPLALC